MLRGPAEQRAAGPRSLFGPGGEPVDGRAPPRSSSSLASGTGRPGLRDRRRSGVCGISALSKRPSQRQEPGDQEPRKEWFHGEGGEGHREHGEQSAKP